MKRLAVVGSGYVGLVAGTMFASVGNRVTCIDKDPDIVDKLNSGQVTIHEPGLEEIMREAIREGNLTFTTDIAGAVAQADASFIAVGTPSMESGAYDFRYVHEAAREIGRALRGQTRHFTVIKSTITPDIYTSVQEILEQAVAGTGADVEVISNPEFLAEGTAVRDFRQPHRVVVGAVSDDARDFMEGLYRPFTKRQPGILRFTDPKSAIVTKLAANSFLASRVSLINELARYCDAVGADIEQVRTGLASDPRIGHQFLFPGPGYGGSCFGKDLRALRESARECGLGLHVIPAIERSNSDHKLYLPARVEAQFGDVRGKCFGFWGVAFKAQTDDIRESPAVDAVEYLLARGAVVRAHDPQAKGRAAERFGDRIQLCDNKYDTVQDADALLILTEWDAYKSPDFYELRERMRQHIVFDARNILDPEEVTAAGLTYVGMGRSAGMRTEAAAATR